MYCELLDQHINESSGAQKTGSGANEKGAVTATLSRQNKVNAAVDGAWQVPPFCKYPVAGPWCLMGPRASRTSVQPSEIRAPAQGYLKQRRRRIPLVPHNLEISPNNVDNPERVYSNARQKLGGPQDDDMEQNLGIIYVCDNEGGGTSWVRLS